MLHGYNDNRNFYYSLAAVQRRRPELQERRPRVRLDGTRLDRAVLLHRATGRCTTWRSAARSGPAIGRTRWRRRRRRRRAGFTFLSFGQFNTTYNGTANTPMQLRQVGRLNAAAGEINAPIDHKYGVRGELVWRHSPLSQETIASQRRGHHHSRRRSQGLLRLRRGVGLAAGRRSDHRRPAGPGAVPALEEVRCAADPGRPDGRLPLRAPGRERHGVRARRRAPRSRPMRRRTERRSSTRRSWA